MILVVASAMPATAASVTGVSAAYFDTCGVISSGDVECWGGRLLGSSLSESSTPVLVSGLSIAVAVSGAEDHRCALLSDGSVECWGAEDFGELGNGVTALEEASTPVP
jgi:alpha-tubulin suppressor-like RCC1 family protein